MLTSWPDSNEPALRGVAFTYDNALAVLALSACGEPELARRVGTALLYAQEHDRYWRDGRLRNAYAAGGLASGAVKLGGWWSTDQQRWQEDGYQAGSDSGNQAWALLALLALADAGHPQYLQGAVKLGSWLVTRLDARGVAGFAGGLQGEEPQPVVQRWKSTEHNVDLAAAFTQLAQRQNDARWTQAAQQAQRFVTAMWSSRCGCFAAGTQEDGFTPNALRALDAQVLPLLGLPQATRRYAQALDTARNRLAARGGGLRYSDAPGALWTEGTAQTALLYRLMQRQSEAGSLLALLTAQRDAQGRYYAAGPGGVATGLGLATAPQTERVYERRPHLAALAWVALAEQGWNPFTLARRLP
ncbi:MAG: hypothetical protein QM718_02300 [Steroidobacteraceae bacterium]